MQRASRRTVAILASALGVSVALVALEVAEARKRPRPPACPAARYLLADPIAVAGGSPRGAFIDVGDSLVSIDDVCDPVAPAKYKGAGKGTLLKVKWPTCAGLDGTVRAKGRIVDDCSTLKARIKAKKFKRRIEAARSVCGDGVVDLGGGEECDPPQPGTCDAECNAGVTVVIGPDGGQVTSGDGRLILDFPAGAVAGDTPITIRRVEPTELTAAVRDEDPGLVYELEPDGLAFAVPVTAILALDDPPQQGNDGVGGTSALLLTANRDGDPAEPLAEQVTVLDGERNVAAVTGQLTHFSSVFRKRIPRIGSIVANVPPEVVVGEPFAVSIVLRLDTPQGELQDVTYDEQTSSPNVAYTGADPRTVGQLGDEASMLIVSVDGYRCSSAGPAVVRAKVSVLTSQNLGLAGFRSFPAMFQVVLTLDCVGAAPTTTTTAPDGSTTTSTTSSTTTTTMTTSTTSTTSTSTSSTTTSSTTTSTIPCALDPVTLVCGGGCPTVGGVPTFCRFSPAEESCTCVPGADFCSGEPAPETGLCGGLCPNATDLCGVLEPDRPDAVCTCAPPCETQDPSSPTQCGGGLCPPGQECVTTADTCACAPVATTSTTVESSTTTTTSTSTSSSSTSSTSATSTTSSSSPSTSSSSSTSATTTSTSTTTSSTPGTTSTTSTTLTSGGRAVQLDFDTGPFPAGTVLCLDQILGGCVAAADACPDEHVHRAISVAGVTGVFADQNEPECGQGSVVTYTLGCGPDQMPNCSSADVAADLTDAAVVPPSGSGESGACSGSLNSSQTILGISCSHDVVDVTEAHVHRGAAGVNGPVVMSLGIGTGGAVFGTVPTSPTDVDDLQAGRLYIDILSSAFPDGSVRGQLASELDLSFPLEPGQEVPPVASSALGSCQLSVDPARTMGSLTCTHDVVNPTMAHIHLGIPGTNGPVAVDLGDPASPIMTTFSIASDLWEAIRTGEAYVNVHSTTFGDGELRGLMAPFIP